jgi:hypothetical protein
VRGSPSVLFITEPAHRRVWLAFNVLTFPSLRCSRHPPADCLMILPFVSAARPQIRPSTAKSLRQQRHRSGCHLGRLARSLTSIPSPDSAIVSSDRPVWQVVAVQRYTMQLHLDGSSHCSVAWGCRYEAVRPSLSLATSCDLCANNQRLDNCDLVGTSQFLHCSKPRSCGTSTYWHSWTGGGPRFTRPLTIALPKPQSATCLSFFP